MKRAKRVGLVVAIVVGSVAAVRPGISAAAPPERFTYVCVGGEEPFRREMPEPARQGIERSIENYNEHNQQGEFCYIL